MPKRTYVDTCVLIAAFRRDQALSDYVIELLEAADRILVVSEAVRLESVPKPSFHKNTNEVAFYEAVFEQAENLPWNNDALDDAFRLATTHDLEPMDAIHVAHAINAQVDEFVSTEKPTKPMYRVEDIPMRSLRFN